MKKNTPIETVATDATPPEPTPAPAPVEALPSESTPAPAPVAVTPPEATPAPAPVAVAAPVATAVESDDLLLAADTQPAIAEPTSNVIPLPAAETDTTPPETGETADDWKCPSCGKEWQYRSHLVRHVKHAHKDQSEQLLASIPPASRRANKGSPQQSKPDFSDIAPASAVTDYHIQAQLAFDSGKGILCMIFGPEWNERTPDERTAMIEAIKQYMKAKGMQDIPPGWLLCFALAAYCGPRFAAPTTRDKIVSGWLWFKGKVSGFFHRNRK